MAVFWFRHVLLLIRCKSFLLLTLVYAGVGSGYSVWKLVRCMVSNVLVFASVIVALLILWFFLLRGWICCVCPVLQLCYDGFLTYVYWQLYLQHSGDKQTKNCLFQFLILFLSFFKEIRYRNSKIQPSLCQKSRKL